MTKKIVNRPHNAVNPINLRKWQCCYLDDCDGRWKQVETDLPQPGTIVVQCQKCGLLTYAKKIRGVERITPRTILKAMLTPVREGRWVKPVHTGFMMGCCDCGSVHKLDFRVVDGQVQYRVHRADWATRMARKEKEFRRT